VLRGKETFNSDIVLLSRFNYTVEEGLKILINRSRISQNGYFFIADFFQKIQNLLFNNFGS
jgi:hypothetical protein